MVDTVTRTAEFMRRMTAPDSTALSQLGQADHITGQILRTAQEQFELVGIRRTTMEDIARKCGVGKATLYRRFPTERSRRRRRRAERGSALSRWQ